MKRAERRVRRWVLREIDRRCGGGDDASAKAAPAAHEGRDGPWKRSDEADASKRG